MSDIYVVKRNGEKELLQLGKIHDMLEQACGKLTGVSVSSIALRAKLRFFNGITTREIHEALINSASDLISEESPNYQYAAGNLLNYELRKTAWRGKTPPNLYKHIIKMVDSGYYTPELLTLYSEDQWHKIESLIDHNRDFKMTYMGIKEYQTKYAMRDRSLDKVVALETPQITYILVAALGAQDTCRIEDVKSLYDSFSLWDIGLPTPIMAGLRSTTRQFSSCTLISTDDTLDSIIASSGAIVKYVSNKAGIGIDASRIRPAGSSVKKDKSVSHTGTIPFFRMFESSLKSCSQGGVRGGSATLTISLWHLDIEEMLVLKNNKGTPDTRVRRMDYAVQINNYLYNRLINKQDVTLLSPSEKECPGLYDSYFKNPKEFERLYEKYEKDPSIRKKVIPYGDLISLLITERKETGRIYIFNVDNVNSHSRFKVPITTSNLCMEITLPTKPLEHLYDENGEIALCTLASINLGNLKNLDDLETICKNAVKFLDNVLTYQDYLLPAAKNSTMKYRPLGIGITNLAYYFAKNGCKYGDQNSLELIHDTMEAISFYCIKASMELSKERGACNGIEDTVWVDGLLPIDTYNKNVDKIIDKKYLYDWEWLRKEILEHGIRNATLLALMPAESSSKIFNSTNGVEPVRSLITTKDNKSHTSKQVVPEYHRLKNKYDMLWDMTTMDGVIEVMAVIQKFTCQSISTNTSYNPKHFKDKFIPLSVLFRDILKANYYGIKTLYYNNTYVDNDTPEVIPDINAADDVTDEVCDSCTI